MTYPRGRPPKQERTNTVPPDRYVAPTGELKVDHYAIWRRVHMSKILAILEWAETPPAERVWPPVKQP